MGSEMCIRDRGWLDELRSILAVLDFIGPCTVCGSESPDTKQPSSLNTWAIIDMSLPLRESSPSMQIFSPIPATLAIRKRAVVPELPQIRGGFGGVKPLSPTPKIVHSPSSRNILAPIDSRQSAMAETSAPGTSENLNDTEPDD